MAERREKVREGVVNEILNGIISGKYQSGDKLPSLNEMAKIFHIGRTTAQEVCKELCERGFCKAVASSGYYIRKLDTNALGMEKRAELTEKIGAVVKECLQIGMSEYDISMIVSDAIMEISETE